MVNKKILVPTDFTEVAETAIKHAAIVAQQMDAELWILHINKPDEEKAAVAIQFDSEIKIALSVAPNVQIKTHSMSGSIFTDITEFGKEIGAHLIFMGTHGVKGVLQQLTGSNALKVVDGSHVPYIITQNKPLEKNGYFDILVPMGLHRDAKQKLVNVANIARYFNSTVHLLTPDEKDEFLSNQVKLNLKYAKNFFEERDINFTTKLCKHGSGSKFANDILEHAVDVKADLLCIMNHHESGLLNMLHTSLEQMLITNHLKLPVMLVNKKQTSIGVGVFQT